MTKHKHDDETLGQVSLERVKPLLATVTPERLLRPTIDLQAVAIVALDVVELVEKPEIFPRFKALPRETFDVDRLTTLRELAYATWYARTQATIEQASTSETRVSAELIDAATETKQRMLAVLAYHFRKDEAVELQLDAIRSGYGYQDLAADLTALANLYAAHQKRLEADRTWYRAQDREEARSHAAAIMGRLRKKGGQDWAEILARIWTLLFEVYEEVRTTGEYLFRNDPLADEFPSLHAATRAQRSARANDAAAEPSPAPSGGAPQPAPASGNGSTGPSTGPVNDAPH